MRACRCFLATLHRILNILYVVCMEKEVRKPLEKEKAVRNIGRRHAGMSLFSCLIAPQLRYLVPSVLGKRGGNMKKKGHA